MESVGTKLKNLRLEKGLTLEDVYKKTKLHLNILKAIEDDSLVGINPIYIRGFLKIYCKFLGVDPKDCISDYREPQSSPNLAKPSSGFAAGARPFIKIKPLLAIAGVILFIVILFNLGKFISSKRRVVFPPKRAPLILPHKVIEKKAPDKRKLTVATEPKKEVFSVIRLGLRAKENSWVDLRVDGKVVFRNMLKKGKFESWAANDKIELSLGNAGAVELELDGRAIPPLGRKNQSIKGIRITKSEGLVVPR